MKKYKLDTRNRREKIDGWLIDFDLWDKKEGIY